MLNNQRLNRMLQIITDVNAINTKKWDDLIASEKDGNYFQSYAAYKLFKSVGNYLPVVLAATDENESVQGILVAVIQRESTGIKGKLSARSIVWGGPVIKYNNKAVLKLLLDAYNQEIKGKAIYTQFRNIFSLDWAKDEFAEAGFSYLEHLNYTVACNTSEEDLLRTMSKSKSRQIKKALSSGASIKIAYSEVEIKTFYNLLTELYRSKVGKPLPPYLFFESFFHNECKSGNGVYLLITEADKIIGGIMCPLTPGKSIYEWYIAGDDQLYKHLYPSILATWAAISYGSKNGLQHFDFLGAGKPDQDYGVREFKSKFGGELHNYGRFEQVHKPLLMQVGKAGLKVINYLRKR